MLDYSSTIDRLSVMKSRFDEGFSASDRLFIRSVYNRLFGKDIRNLGCPDCYRDAYMEIIHRLKKDKIMPKEKKFILRNGVLLHAFKGEVFTNANLTDEIAMDALNENMSREKLFARVPDNWKDLCKARKVITDKENATKASLSKEELQDNIESLKSALESAKKETADVTAKLEAEEKKTAEAVDKAKVSEAKIAELEKAVAEAKEAAGKHDADIEALKAKHAEALKAKDAEIATLGNEKASLEKTNQELASQTAKLEAEVDTLKNQLKDAQKKASAASPAEKTADAAPKK